MPAPASAPVLRSGDVLLYSRRSLFNWLIRIKTWSRFTHVEMVCCQSDGEMIAYASRNREGVARYPVDYRGLALVLRPCVPCGPTRSLDLNESIAWFDASAKGQRYDWLGLINFTSARIVGQNNRAMFCSEFIARFMRNGGCELFPYADADTIAPRDFAMCPCLETVWRSDDEQKRFEKGTV